MKPYLYSFLIIASFIACDSSTNTKITIEDNLWLINGIVTNEKTPAEGLLMNVRMVNTAFEDESGHMQAHDTGFSPEANTSSFIQKIPDYVNHGINAFTISLQGGMPGYEGAINSAFNADGSLRPGYMARIHQIIKAANRQEAAIILTCFYQRQHSHPRALAGKDAIKNAVINTVQWIMQQDYHNVILEISNEYAHGGFKKWQDGEWLRSVDGQVELMQLAKKRMPGLLVSTSGMGNGHFEQKLAEQADFLLIHFNNTALSDIPARVEQLKRYRKPIICNEDDKIGYTGAQAAYLTVKNGAGWGFMHSKKNQNVPFEFDGAADDPEVYNMVSQLTSLGSIEDLKVNDKLTAIITRPKDGDLFQQGDAVIIEASISGIDNFEGMQVQFSVNGEKIGVKTSHPWQIILDQAKAGNYKAVVSVRDNESRELMRSREVDFEVVK